MTTEKTIEIPFDVLDIDQSKNPRRYIDPKKIEDLANSIHTHGLLHPVTVRPIKHPVNQYSLIAGFRRSEAVQKLGWKSISATIKNVSEIDAEDIAVQENLQNESMPPIDEAKYFKKLMENHTWNQNQVADHVNKSNGYISYTLSLLELPEEVQTEVNAGTVDIVKARELGRAARHGTDADVIKQLMSKATTLSLTELRAEVNAAMGRPAEGSRRQARKPKESDTRSRDEIVTIIESVESEIEGRLLPITTRDKYNNILNVLKWVLRLEDKIDVLGERSS